MANNMAAIGRANPIGSINEWQKHESNMATQQQNRAVQDLNMVNIKQTNQENQLKLDAKKQEQAELSKEIPWEVVSMGFEGGDEEGSPSALINKVATGLGIIDMSQGGAGTINGKRGKKLAAFMSQPQMLHKMSRTRVNWTRGNFVKAQQALAEKPTDKNLQAAFEKATIDYKDATSQGKAFDNLFKEQKQTQDEFKADFLQKRTQYYKNQGKGDSEAQQLAVADMEKTKLAGKHPPKSTVVNVGDIGTKIQTKSTAEDLAFWKSTKAVDKAYELAEGRDADNWISMSQQEKDASALKIMDGKIKSVAPEAQFGIDDKTKVKGWYIVGDNDKLELVQRWGE